MFGQMRVAAVVAVVGVVLVTVGAVAGQGVGRQAGREASATAPVRAAAARTALGLGFVENRGQTDPRVRYYARGDDYGFYLTRDEVMLAF